MSLSRKTARERKRRLILELLEERIVLDASVAPVHHDHGVDNHHPADLNHLDTTAPGSDSRAGHGQLWQGQSVDAPSPVFQGAHGHHGLFHDGSTGSNPLSQSFAQGLDVILVASDVQDIQAIQNAATPGTDVIIYDGTQGTLASIDASLTKLVATSGEKIANLSIISHGDPGIINISETDNWGLYKLGTDPAPWTDLGHLLTKGAQIDLYGCNIGQGQEGAQLVRDIAHLTGATVWANDNATGSGPGLDWTLDVHSGPGKFYSLLDTSKLANSGIDLDNTIIIDGDFENGYQGWTLLNTTPFPQYPWLSAWGIDANGNPLVQGHLNSLSDLDATKAGVYSDYSACAAPGSAYNPAKVYTTVPLLYPGELSTAAGVTATDLTYTGNIAYAAQNFSADMTMYQDVALPAGTKTLSFDMSYWNYAATGFTDVVGGTHNQYLSVSIIDETNPALSQTLVLTANAGNTAVAASQYLTGSQTNMTAYSFNVSQNAGDTVRIEVDIKADRGVLDAAFADFAVHTAPTTTGIPNVTVQENASPTTVDLSHYFSDAQTSNLTYTVVGNDNTNIASTSISGSILTINWATNQYGTADITVQASNGDPASTGTTAVFMAQVQQVDQPPVELLPTTAQSTSQGVPLVFSAAANNQISVTDPDAGPVEQVLLVASNGTLTLSETSGLTFLAGTGTNDSFMTIQGSLTSINAALNGMSLNPTSGSGTTAMLQMVTNDLASGIPGGPKTDYEWLSISIT